MSTREDEIVAAAYRRVADVGVAGLRMRDVAQAAGVNIATVHYYADNKAGLIRRVVDFAHDRFSQQTIPTDARTPADRLREHLLKVFTMVEQDPLLPQVLAEVAVHARHDTLVAEIVTASETRWRDAFQRMLEPLSPASTKGIALLAILAVKGACLPVTRPADLHTARDELIAYLTFRIETEVHRV